MLPETNPTVGDLLKLLSTLDPELELLIAIGDEGHYPLSIHNGEIERLEDYADYLVLVAEF